MKGRVSFIAENISGRTRLINSFYTPPFNLANISVKGADTLQLMMRSTSPGILDGDQYEIDIKLMQDTAVLLTTQSFQRLFDMKTGASQTTHIELAANSALEFIAHPCVPHKNSIFRSSTRIELHETARLTYGEIFTCGRALNGEQFQFKLYQSRTEIIINGKLHLKENLRIAPFEANFQGLGMLEKHPHQAALTCVDQPARLQEMENMLPLLEEIPEITWGFSRPSKNMLVLRILGFSAYKLYDILQSVATKYRKESIQQ